MFNPYVKAVLAAAIALIGGLATGFDDSVLTTSEIIVAIVAAMAALALVWANPVFKWLWGGAIAFVTALGIALQDDAVSAQEWVTIAGATLGALYLVYAVKNTEASSKPNP